jgi:hypothetical protein
MRFEIVHAIIDKKKGRYSSGQRGQTVNLLCELRRFESCSPHKKKKLRFWVIGLRFLNLRSKFKNLKSELSADLAQG